MFDFVPRGRVQREFVGGRHMPAEKREVEREPACYRMEKTVSDPANEFVAKNRREKFLKDCAGQTTKEWNCRRA